MDQEAWHLTEYNFWVSYLARITQYTLATRCGGSADMLYEARSWSLQRMLTWYRSFGDQSRWFARKALIPASIVTIGCHIHCQATAVSPCIATWSTTANQSAVDYNYDGVLESTISYRNLKVTPMIIISDDFATLQTEGVSGGMGYQLTNKVGYTNAYDIHFRNGDLQDLESKLAALRGTTLDLDVTTVHVFLSMLSAPGVPMQDSQSNRESWMRIGGHLKRFRSRPYVIINTTAVDAIADYAEQEAYRKFVDDMTESIDSFCLIDKGVAYWEAQFG